MRLSASCTVTTSKEPANLSRGKRNQVKQLANFCNGGTHVESFLFRGKIQIGIQAAFPMLNIVGYGGEGSEESSKLNETY